MDPRHRRESARPAADVRCAVDAVQRAAPARQSAVPGVFESAGWRSRRGLSPPCRLLGRTPLPRRSVPLRRGGSRRVMCGMRWFSIGHHERVISTATNTSRPGPARTANCVAPIQAISSAMHGLHGLPTWPSILDSGCHLRPSTRLSQGSSMKIATHERNHPNASSRSRTFAADHQPRTKKTDQPDIVFKQAEKILWEMIADFNNTAMALSYRIIRWLWSRLYDHLIVNKESLDRFKRIARDFPTIVIPSHKSHTAGIACWLGAAPV